MSEVLSKENVILIITLMITAGIVGLYLIYGPTVIIPPFLEETFRILLGFLLGTGAISVGMRIQSQIQAKKTD